MIVNKVIYNQQHRKRINKRKEVWSASVKRYIYLLLNERKIIRNTL